VRTGRLKFRAFTFTRDRERFKPDANQMFVLAFLDRSKLETERLEMANRIECE